MPDSTSQVGHLAADLADFLGIDVDPATALLVRALRAAVLTAPGENVCRERRRSRDAC